MTRFLRQIKREEREERRRLMRAGALPKQLHLRAIDHTKKIAAPPLKLVGRVLSGTYNWGITKLKHRYTKKLAIAGLVGMLGGATLFGVDYKTHAVQDALGGVAKRQDFSSFYKIGTPDDVSDELMLKHALIHGEGTQGKRLPFEVKEKCEVAFYDEGGNLLECTNSYMTYNQVVDKFGTDFFDSWVAVEDGDFYEHHGADVGGFGMAVWEQVKGMFGARSKARGGSTLTQTWIDYASGIEKSKEGKKKRELPRWMKKFEEGLDKTGEMWDAVGLEQQIRDDIYEQVHRRQMGQAKQRRDYIEDLFSADELGQIQAGLTRKEESEFSQLGAKRKILEELFNLPVILYSGEDAKRTWKDPDLGTIGSYGEAFDAFFPHLYKDGIKETDELILQRKVAMAYAAGGLRQPGRHFQHAKEYVKMKRGGFDFEGLDAKIKELGGAEHLTGKDRRAHAMRRSFDRTVGRTLDTFDAKLKEGFETEDIGDKVDVAETLESLLIDALEHEQENGTVPHSYLQLTRRQLDSKWGLSGDRLTGLIVVTGYDEEATEKVQEQITRAAAWPLYNRDGVHMAATLIDKDGIVRVGIGDTKNLPPTLAINYAGSRGPVGSTHKPFSALHALETGVIIPGKTMLYSQNSIISHTGRPVHNAGPNARKHPELPSPGAVLKEGIPFTRPAEWLRASRNVPSIALFRNLPNYGAFLENIFGEGTIQWTAAGKQHDQVAMGIMEASLVDITRAHTLFLEGDERRAGEVLPEARFVLAIYDNNGNLLYEDKIVDPDPQNLDRIRRDVEWRENADELTRFVANLTPVAVVQNLENLEIVKGYMRQPFLPLNGTMAGGAQTYQLHFIGKTGTSNLSDRALAIVSSPDHGVDHYSLGIVFYDENAPSPSASKKVREEYARNRGMVSRHAGGIAATALAGIDGAGRKSRTTEYEEIVRQAESTLMFATYLEQELTSGFRVDSFGLGDEVQYFEDIKPRHRRFFDLTEGYPEVVVASSYETWKGWMEDHNYLRIESNAEITEIDDVWGLVEKVNLSHPELARMEADLFYATRAGIPRAEELYQRTRELTGRLDEQVEVRLKPNGSMDTRTSPRTESFEPGRPDIIYLK